LVPGRDARKDHASRGSDDVRIFDWDVWRIDVATDDLAYMMALHWFPDVDPDHQGKGMGARLRFPRASQRNYSNASP
jgi:hypothetical protein